MKKRISAVLCVAIVSCAVMALVDGILKPGYAIKSAIKLMMFLGLPLLLSLRHRELSLKPLLRFQKKGFLTALGLGLGLFALILGAYWGFSVNGQYCNYGIDEQPVEDGDAFVIAYTK